MFGWDGARRPGEVPAARERPRSSTSLAFVNALQSLGIKRVSIAATYPEPSRAALSGCSVMRALRWWQRRAMISRTAGRGTASVPAGSLIGMATAGRRPDAEAVLIPDTALHTVRFLPELERIAFGDRAERRHRGRLREGLRLIGATPSASQAGTHLFAAG